MSENIQDKINDLIHTKESWLKNLKKQHGNRFEETMIICERINTKIQRYTFREISEVNHTVKDIQERLKPKKGSNKI